MARTSEVIKTFVSHWNAYRATVLADKLLGRLDPRDVTDLNLVRAIAEWNEATLAGESRLGPPSLREQHKKRG